MSYIGYKLTLDPMSLFKDSTMRKPDKSPLRNILLAKEVVNTNIMGRVIDGGCTPSQSSLGYNYEL